MDEILKQIKEERQRQDNKWGTERDQHPAVWMTILSEEAGEVAQEICFSNFEIDNLSSNYRTELIQVAAVAVAAIENYDKNKEVDS